MTRVDSTDSRRSMDEVMDETIMIGDRRIGRGSCYIVAELSGNHKGDLDRALRSIRAADDAGVDAVKLQTYTPDTITIDASDPEFIVPGEGEWGGRTLYDLYDEAHTPWEWHEQLFEEGRQCGLDVFSSPFDPTAVDLLEDLGAPAYKIASFELVDDGLLQRVAHTGKPVILSTGMASLEEIAHAVDCLRTGGCDHIVLLRCTSSYPAPDSEMNLASIPVLKEALNCPVGLSDHSLGWTAPVVAVTLGACMIEKHFTLSRQAGGVDSHFSLEPGELEELVENVRRAEEMMGRAKFGPGKQEMESLRFRRSLYVVQHVDTGEKFTEENVRSIRPGFGLSPRYRDVVLGRRANRSIDRGTPLSWDLVCG